jgi:hypothetical protein
LTITIITSIIGHHYQCVDLPPPSEAPEAQHLKKTRSSSSLIATSSTPANASNAHTSTHSGAPAASEGREEEQQEKFATLNSSETLILL